MKTEKGMTRRQVFARLGQIGGTALMIQGMSALGFMSSASARMGGAKTGILARNSGVGKSVAIIGAGVSGFTSAYELTQAGYDVTILEANNRMGGRSLTVRTGDTFHEQNGLELTCQFEKMDSNGNAIYLNAGPGRIPQHHELVLEYCRTWDVKLEPFIFACRTNLLQADGFNGGKPMQVRHMKHNLRGEIAEMLAKSVRQNELDHRISKLEQDKLLDMLREFGDLTKVDPKFAHTGFACQRKAETDVDKNARVLRYCKTDRAGFVVPPGIREGITKPQVSLNDILFSDLWNTELFNDMRYLWQTSLMQPIGGMDMLWRRAMTQEVPGSGGRTLENLVKLGHPVVRIQVKGSDDKVAVTTRSNGVEETQDYDFCISTMAPSQLDRNVENNFSREFRRALEVSGVADVASCKVGWQTKNRFWERNDSIYGGISWTKHIISQVWYPSNSYHANIGVLTGAYNRGDDATIFGNLPHEERLRKAVQGGELLHPGFRQNIDYDKGLSIAWQKMQYFAGGWQHAHEHLETVYNPLMKPQGNFFMSGDVMSYNGGWMEGAMQSAQHVVSQIAERVAEPGRMERLKAASIQAVGSN